MKQFTAFNEDGSVIKSGDTWAQMDPPRNLNCLPQGTFVYRKDGVWLTARLINLGHTSMPVHVKEDDVPELLRAKAKQLRLWSLLLD